MLNRVSSSNNYIQVFSQTSKLQGVVDTLFNFLGVDNKQITQTAISDIMQINHQNFIAEVFKAVINLDSQLVDARLEVTLMLLDGLFSTANNRPEFTNLIKPIIKDINVIIFQGNHNISSVENFWSGVKNIVFKHDNSQIVTIFADVIDEDVNEFLKFIVSSKSVPFASDIFTLCPRSVFEFPIELGLSVVSSLDINTLAKCVRFYKNNLLAEIAPRVIFSFLLTACDRGMIKSRDVVAICDDFFIATGHSFNILAAFNTGSKFPYLYSINRIPALYTSDQEFLLRVDNLYKQENNDSNKFILNIISLLSGIAANKTGITFNMRLNVSNLVAMIVVIKLFSQEDRNLIIDHLMSLTNLNSSNVLAIAFLLGSNATVIDDYLLSISAQLNAGQFADLLMHLFGLLDQIAVNSQVKDYAQNLSFSKLSLTTLKMISPYLIIYSCSNGANNTNARLLELYNNHPNIAQIFVDFDIEGSFIVPVEGNQYIIFSSVFKTAFGDCIMNRQEIDAILNLPVYILSNGNMTPIANNSNIIPQLLLKKISSLIVGLPKIYNIEQIINTNIDLPPNTNGNCFINSSLQLILHKSELLNELIKLIYSLDDIPTYNDHQDQEGHVVQHIQNFNDSIKNQNILLKHLKDLLNHIIKGACKKDSKSYNEFINIYNQIVIFLKKVLDVTVMGGGDPVQVLNLIFTTGVAYINTPQKIDFFDKLVGIKNVDDKILNLQSIIENIGDETGFNDYEYQSLLNFVIKNKLFQFIPLFGENVKVFKSKIAEGDNQTIRLLLQLINNESFDIFVKNQVKIYNLSDVVDVKTGTVGMSLETIPKNLRDNIDNALLTQKGHVVMGFPTNQQANTWKIRNDNQKESQLIINTDSFIRVILFTTNSDRGTVS